MRFILLHTILQVPNQLFRRRLVSDLHKILSIGRQIFQVGLLAFW